VPSEPLNLAVKPDTITKTSVTLMWDSPRILGTNALTHYQLFTVDDQDVDTLHLDNIAVANEYDVTGLTTGHTYHFVLKAVNSVGAGASSASKQVTAVSKPERVTDINVSAYSATSYTLSWTAPLENGGTNNLVYRFEMLNRVTNAYDELAANLVDTHYEVVGAANSLSAGSSYTFRVKAQNEEYTGDGTDFVQIHKMTPLAPVNVASTEPAIGELQLTW
jgi:hypothetical protein